MKNQDSKNLKELFQRRVDIRGYKGLYKVGSCGHVYSILQGKELEETSQTDGYLTVNLSRTYYIENLLNQAFPKEGLEVRGSLVHVQNEDNITRMHCIEELLTGNFYSHDKVNSLTASHIRNIPGYEGIYTISDSGEVYSLRERKVVLPSIMNDKRVVELYKTYYVYELVIFHFRPHAIWYGSQTVEMLSDDGITRLYHIDQLIADGALTATNPNHFLI